MMLRITLYHLMHYTLLSMITGTLDPMVLRFTPTLKIGLQVHMLDTDHTTKHLDKLCKVSTTMHTRWLSVKKLNSISSMKTLSHPLLITRQSSSLTLMIIKTSMLTMNQSMMMIIIFGSKVTICHPSLCLFMFRRNTMKLIMNTIMKYRTMRILYTMNLSTTSQSITNTSTSNQFKMSLSTTNLFIMSLFTTKLFTTSLFTTSLFTTNLFTTSLYTMNLSITNLSTMNLFTTNKFIMLQSMYLSIMNQFTMHQFMYPNIMMFLTKL